MIIRMPSYVFPRTRKRLGGWISSALYAGIDHIRSHEFYCRKETLSSPEDLFVTSGTCASCPAHTYKKDKIYVASKNCESFELDLFINSVLRWVKCCFVTHIPGLGFEVVHARFSSCASFSADVISHCSMQNPGVSAGMTTSAWVFSKCCSALFTSPFVNQRPSKEVAHETLSLVHRCLMEYVGVNAPVSWICWRCSLHRLE